MKHTEDVEKILNDLKSSKELGLASAEATLRLKTYGLNELEEKKKKSPWKMLFEQFQETMVVILIVAAIISAFLGKETETIAIIAIVILFAVLGAIQEYRAEKAMAALKKLSVPNIKTIRDGIIQETPSNLLVPGDIVLLESGNIVPCDARIVESANLKINESPLTGETEAVEKNSKTIAHSSAPLGDRFNMAYMGTTIVYGRGKAIVVGTGMKTELGKIAGMIQDMKSEKTPLQKRLDQLGKWLALAGGLSALLVFIIGVLKGQSFTDMFLVGISVAVAVVPEGLPAVVTITLALGSQKMLKRNALIRKLPAVETLGSVTVICSDKTGTLTENKMTVISLETGTNKLSFPAKDHNYPEDIRFSLLIGALCSDAQIQNQEGQQVVIGEPTETAIVEAALKAGLKKNELEADLPRVHEIPFESLRKRMSTIHRLTENSSTFSSYLQEIKSPYVVLTKGAVDNLLYISSHIHTKNGIEELTPEWESRIRMVHDEMAKEGVRVLGVAYKGLELLPDSGITKDLEKGLIFSGIIGLQDPPRPEVALAVAKCKSAGIRPVMITGDYPLTAISIAKRLGISDAGGFITSENIDRMMQADLEKYVNSVNIFARIAPQDKLKIVTTLQNQGEIVAMTGDGVNDSPALKKANIGVAMGITGSDVSKESSDMVLLDDNFATIVKAVEEGRAIFDNLIRFIKFSLGGNLGKVLVMLLAPLMGIIIALNPMQLLWLNLLTDGFLGLGLGVEPSEKDTMSKPPRTPKDPILNKKGLIHVTWVGILIAVCSLSVGYYYYEAANPENMYWQSMIFATIGFTQIGHALGLRASSRSIFSVTSNKIFSAMILLTLILHLSVIYVPFLENFFGLMPIEPIDLFIAFMLGVIVLVMVQIEKRLFQSKNGHV